MPGKLSHYDRAGRARMVDVSGKTASKREAEASAFVAIKPAVLAELPEILRAILWKWRESLGSWPRNEPPS